MQRSISSSNEICNILLLNGLLVGRIARHKTGIVKGIQMNLERLATSTITNGLTYGMIAYMTGNCSARTGTVYGMCTNLVGRLLFDNSFPVIDSRTLFIATFTAGVFAARYVEREFSLKEVAYLEVTKIGLFMFSDYLTPRIQAALTNNRHGHFNGVFQR